MNKKNIFQQLLSALCNAKVEFILGGGVALVLHGVERMTMDIDISLHMTRDNVFKFLNVMKREGMKPRAPVPPEVLLDPEKIKMMIEEKHAVVFSFIDLHDPFRQVDVFLIEDLSYDKLKKDTVNIDIGGCKIGVISKEKLIELKKSISPARDKDIFDIKALKELLGGKGNK